MMDAFSEEFLVTRNVSRETVTKLENYLDLLRRWNKKINLVSAATLTDFWSRHVVDSLQLLDHIDQAGGCWMDLGSGGGMPGLPCAIVLQERASRYNITLIESDQRKAEFLRTVSRETSTTVTILPQRIETCHSAAADILTARALAPLKDLLEYGEQLLRPGGKCLFSKGERHAQEVKEAQTKWSFSLTIHPSLTGQNSAVLEIGDIARA